jgi:hypothetical protein
MHSSPELFPRVGWQPSAGGASPGVRTPFGEIDVTAAVDDHPLRLDAAVVYGTVSGARLWVWEGGVFRAELLRCRPAYRLPDGMRVAGCEAAMWRLLATERPAECEVRCRWQAAGREPGSPEPGEHVESQLWSDEGRQVSIGTLKRGGAVHYLPDGFAVSAPLERGAAFQTHFVVAWSAERSARETTRYAVDCTPGQVLAGIASPAD